METNSPTDKEVNKAIHKLFWGSMLKYKLDFTLSFLQVVYYFIFNTFFFIEVAYGLQAIAQGKFDEVYVHITRMLIALVVSAIAFALGIFAFNRHGIKHSSNIVKTLFANYLDKDYEFFEDHHVGALSSYASRMRQAANDYARVFMFDLLRVMTIVVSGIAVLFIQSPPLAMVTLACILIVLSSTFAAQKYRSKYRKMTSEAESRLAGVLGDALSHASVVKSFGTRQYESDRLDTSLHEWGVSQKKTWDLAIPVTSIRNVALVGSMVVLLIVSANMYKNGQVELAVITLVQLYVVRLVAIAIDIGDIVKMYDASVGAAYMPVKTMLTRRRVQDTDRPETISISSKLPIELENVTHVYPQQAAEKHAVKNVTLHVKSGEKIGIVGYSGSGKTTLTKLLMRFMDPSEGSILVDGHDLRALKQDDLRSTMSYVPQEPLLFHRSIWENIAYGDPDASDAQVEIAAKAAYVHEFVEDLPLGYQTLVGERGIKLSGGQRQRVAIARAMLKNAPILVLDEATSALDSRSEQLIQKALWKLMKDRTAIIIAHRLSTIQRMDRIVVMDKGKIVQLGSHDELLKDKDGIYAQLWSHQSGGYIDGELKSD